MQPSVAIAVTVIIAIGIGLWWKQNQYEVVMVQSGVDKAAYLVRNLPDRQRAADALARIRGKLNRLAQHLMTRFAALPCVERLKARWHGDADRMSESTPDSKFTSYSVNKGETIHFCLRQRDNKREELVDDNIMMFVSIHEMAHIMTESVGHLPEFWHTMAFALREGAAIGVYTPRDFAEEPAEYCGVQITDTPRVAIDELDAEAEEAGQTGAVPRTTGDEGAKVTRS